MKNKNQLNKKKISTLTEDKIEKCRGKKKIIFFKSRYWKARKLSFKYSAYRVVEKL